MHCKWRPRILQMRIADPSHRLLLVTSDHRRYSELARINLLIRVHSDARTECAKNVCPRLRDLATAPAGNITQPRTHFFGQLCISCLESGMPDRQRQVLVSMTSRVDEQRYCAVRLW